MDPNNQNPQTTPQDTAADNAALDAVNKLDQETPTPSVDQPVVGQAAPAPAPSVPEQPATPVEPAPAQSDAQMATPIGGGAKKTSSTTKILVIVLIVAVLALAGFLAWQYFTTGRLI